MNEAQVNKLPTTEELFVKYSYIVSFEESEPERLVDKEDFQAALIEFAKAHVQAALLAVLGVEVDGCGCMEADTIGRYAVELIDKYSEATNLEELDISTMVETGLETLRLYRKYDKA